KSLTKKPTYRKPSIKEENDALFEEDNEGDVITINVPPSTLTNSHPLVNDDNDKNNDKNNSNVAINISLLPSPISTPSPLISAFDLEPETIPNLNFMIDQN